MNTKVYTKHSIPFTRFVLYRNSGIATHPDAGDDFEMLTHYSGRDCKFVPDRDGTVTIKVCTVEKSRTGKPLYYFDREEYAKRLIGNSYSIPAVEHLLRPLQDIFHRKDYSEANYRFQWVQSDVGENI